MKKRISTAAYLAGVTTLAVSLPAMAETATSDRSVQMDRGGDAGHAQKAILKEEKPSDT